MDTTDTTRLHSFSALFAQALKKRQPLLNQLHSEQTNAYRLFHGISEGIPGLTVDRYGSLLLLQTFREPLSPHELELMEHSLREALDYPFTFAYHHRGKSSDPSLRSLQTEALEEMHCEEFGLKFLIRARHPGIDPWLFLDLRAGRRFLKNTVKDLSVLNLFSYTCSIGITAAAAGAREVWNVDFAASNLEVGRRNALLNALPEERFQTIHEDCLPVMRQLAGLSTGGRNRQKREFKKFEPRHFDLVFLDPPAWSKGAFGAVDVTGDYPSLFKAAVLTAKPGGGRVIATNHVSSVNFDSWIDVLQRCALKAGRPIRCLQRILPEDDFPSFDGQSPLKIVVCEV